MKGSKKELFRGVCTALITPHREGKVDYDTYVRLIERQIAAGVRALVIGGTTAEAATLSDGERYRLFELSREVAGGRCALIFGTGTNDTRIAIKHTEAAEKIGCDGVLLVTPYYNKGTKRGVYEHYVSLAKCTNLPIILYNVPSRTGVNLALDTVEKLSELENIVGIKEASGDMARLEALSKMKGLALYSGNDADTLPVMKLGGSGVISVVSNLYPRAMVKMLESWDAGDRVSAAEAADRLSPIINALFLETNPAPLKYAMSRLGLCTGEMRLPMAEVEDSTKRELDAAMREDEGVLWE